ncbi:hypothetical protein ACRW9N_10255 [Listeria aquatica]|uniref:GRAM domain-containing protein n=1 Tax=Listeria aquatica FSL S10-1188 TaxID=1265818 RepID=W7BAA3_9LIST|nr:hypothetical protein [Listeria aquatica]EUJ21605.1 hypothetical protein MAQA_02787 [Listeria aquatica FSL S10-1188]
MAEREVLYKGLANVKTESKAAPGKLYLTSDSIIHQPNEAFDDKIEIKLEEIARFSGKKTKFFGLAVLANLIEIELNDGTVYQFVVNRQKKWLGAISKQLGERSK